MNMRGSIPRRQPSGNVVPRQVVVNQVIAAPQYHDCGELVVPANGSVTALRWRFPTNGVVEHASIQITGVQPGSGLMAICFVEDEMVGSINIPSDGTYDIGSMPVDGVRTVEVKLGTFGNPEEISVKANIAFVYRTTNAKV